jgi:hypothetical protein
MPEPLDNPIRGSLIGAHAHLAERRGNVLRYQTDVAPFLALPDEPRDGDWADAADRRSTVFSAARVPEAQPAAD